MWDIDFNRLRDVFVYDPQAPMIFSSGIFLWLFAAFILVYLLLQHRLTVSHEYRNDAIHTDRQVIDCLRVRL